MVKVVGLTEEEVALREKTSKLVKITKDFFGHPEMNRVILDRGRIFLKNNGIIPKYPIAILPDLNRITVNDQSYLGIAIDLALEYEKIDTIDEWIVKKTYEK